MPEQFTCPVYQVHIGWFRSACCKRCYTIQQRLKGIVPGSGGNRKLFRARSRLRGNRPEFVCWGVLAFVSRKPRAQVGGASSGALCSFRPAALYSADYKAWSGGGEYAKAPGIDSSGLRFVRGGHATTTSAHCG